MRKPFIVVVDDRKQELNDAAKAMERQGFNVVKANSNADAKVKINALMQGRVNFKILTDLDMGRKIYQKHRMRDGYRLAKWAVKQGVPPQDVTIHSTEFEPTASPLLRWFNEHTIIRRTKRRGINTQPKSTVLGYAGSSSIPAWYKLGVRYKKPGNPQHHGK